MPDLGTYVLGVASGLIVGLVGGWFAHRLTVSRARDERRIADDTAKIDRCREVFAAHIDHVIAYHRNASNLRALKARREELEHRHPNETPEVFLDGTQEWEHYHATERRMLLAHKGESEERIEWTERVRLIKESAVAVHRLLDERRRYVRR